MLKESRVESRESSDKIRSYRDLIAWQKAMQLMLLVYEETRNFPKDEQYGLTSQIKRSAISVPSNIAEGSSRRSTAEFLRFLNITRGSLAELETQIEAAYLLQYVAKDKHEKLLTISDELGRVIQGLYNSLQAKNTRL
jgi:four helix bundle protein